MTNKHMKRCSTHVIREMQIKARHHHTPIRIAEIQNTDHTKWQRCEVKCTATWVERLEVSYKTKHTLTYGPAIMLLGIYLK